VRFWLHTAALLLATSAILELASWRWLGVPLRLRFDPRYDQIGEPDRLAVQSTEGFSRGRTNELGHLDVAMPSPVPPDGILVVGDSYTEGRQVAMDERFTSRAAARLHRHVYNVGHAGWSPINTLAFLRAELPSFQPSTVIVQVSGNDLEDIVSPRAPHVVDGNGGLTIVLPDRSKRGLGAWITRAREAVSRSALVGDVIAAAITVARGQQDEAAAGGDHCDKLDPLAIKGVEWLVAQLATTHRDVRLLYLPALDYHAGCVDRCAPARALFERASAARGLRLIDASAAICRRFATTHQPLNGFSNTVPGMGHFNREGHEVIADELQRELAARPSGP
jgi:lysophospholipase L1-like esterase